MLPPVSTDTPALPDLTPLPGKQTGAEVGQLVRADAAAAGARTAVPGIASRRWRRWSPTWSRRPTRSSTRSPRATSTITARSWATCCCRSSSSPSCASPRGRFGIDDVARGIVAKLVHRHPHVFGDAMAKDADAVLANWAKLKAEEKAEKGKHGALDGIPRSAPALLRATRAGEKAGAVGFDWPDAERPRAKVDEELPSWTRPGGGGDRAEMAARARRRAVRASSTWRASWGSTPSRRCATRPIASRQRFRHLETGAGRRGARRRRRERGRAGSALAGRQSATEAAVRVAAHADPEAAEPHALRLDAAAPSRGPGDKDKAGREAMYRAELEERAALLHRLGHGKQQTRARLAANLAWDFARRRHSADPGGARRDRRPRVRTGDPDGRAPPQQRRHDDESRPPTLGVAAFATHRVGLRRRRDRSTTPR